MPYFYKLVHIAERNVTSNVNRMHLWSDTRTVFNIALEQSAHCIVSNGVGSSQCLAGRSEHGAFLSHWLKTQSPSGVLTWLTCIEKCAHGSLSMPSLPVPGRPKSSKEGHKIYTWAHAGMQGTPIYMLYMSRIRIRIFQQMDADQFSSILKKKKTLLIYLSTVGVTDSVCSAQIPIRTVCWQRPCLWETTLSDSERFRLSIWVSGGLIVVHHGRGWGEDLSCRDSLS